MTVGHASFPNGFKEQILVRGIPILNSYSGSVFWVSSGTGVSTNSGKSPSHPLLTITAALAKCTANKGDIIMCMPGHAESIIAGGGLEITKAGVSIVGIGSGENRPIITFTTATAASILVSAANCYITNFVFKCNIANQNHMFDVVATDFTVDKCEFREGSATGLSFITADTADTDSNRLNILNSAFYAPTAGNYANAIQLAKDFVSVRIENCNIYGDFDDSCIDIPAGGNAQIDCIIKDCILVNLLSGSYAIKVNGTSSTGKIVNCKVQTDVIGTAVDAGGLEMYDVLYHSGTDQAGWSPIVSQPDSTQNLIGADNSDNGFASTNVVANGDGSVLERLEYVQSGMAGSFFYIKKTLTSSAVTQAGVDITGVSSGGDLWIEDIVIQTDGTGLATGTNFKIVTNNAKGGAINFQEAVANLTTNVTVDFSNASITKIKGVLESGKKLTAKSTVADCTGAGTIDVYIKFIRLAAGATIAAA